MEETEQEARARRKEQNSLIREVHLALRRWKRTRYYKDWQTVKDLLGELNTIAADFERSPMYDVLSPDKVAFIRELNDRFRTSFQGGQIVLTRGVATLPDMVTCTSRLPTRSR
jgi:hypothetical protein